MARKYFNFTQAQTSGIYLLIAAFAVFIFLKPAECGFVLLHPLCHIQSAAIGTASTIVSIILLSLGAWMLITGGKK